MFYGIISIYSMHGLVSVCKRYIVSIGYQPVGVILRRLKKTAWVDLLTKYDLHEISCDENSIPITMRYKPSGSDSNNIVIVPKHGSRDIAIGTLKSIMKQAGLR